ncbi:MAG: 16S rRNA (adenine(1518)-N(6)/adenine(1519)-N(6))-dimethyltransferase RsmA [Acidobacteriota bacterium]|jgi:16S rRNA (adenine1518-N6/adenine1519-N6)-dimethyltransferase|nr:16S rRNA (adenine(1518)-N(6)/adenine(1519)-N(6))-dimethyltransferase RsmA [Acidobacteriota bacterium]
MRRSAPLGQNFLVNDGVAQRIVDQVPATDEPVIEIGPGRGMLTRRLLERFPGRRLIVVEKDAHLAAQLRLELKDDIQVICRDVRECRAADISPGAGAYLVGNIPYLISTPLMEWILFSHEVWTGGVMMTQDEFARRLLQGSGPLSTAIRTFFTLTPVMRVSPGSFNPPPAVYSRIFSLAPRDPGVNARNYHAFLKRCFIHPRRSLRNNLRNHFPPSILDNMLEQLDIPADTRAEAVADPDLLALFTRLLPPGDG